MIFVKKAIFILFLFVALVSSVPNPSNLEKRAKVGLVAFGSFTVKNQQVSGFSTFTQITSSTCRGTMQFNKGFTSKNRNDYTFKIGNIDITNDIRPLLSINSQPGGTGAIKKDFKKFSCQQLVGKHFVIKRKSKTIGDVKIKKV